MIEVVAERRADPRRGRRGHRRLDQRPRHHRAAPRPARLAESARHFELIQDLVATCGFDGYFKVHQRRLGADARLDRRELLPNPFIEIVHPDDREAVEAEVAKLAEGGDDRRLQDPGRDQRRRLGAGPSGRRSRPGSPRPASSTAAGARSPTRMRDRAGARSRAPPARRRPADRQGRQLGARPRDRRAPLVRRSSTATTASTPAGRRRRPAELDRGDPPRRPRATCSRCSRRSRPSPRSFERSYRVVLANGTVREIEVEGRPFVDRRRRDAADGDQPRRHRRARRGAAQGRVLPARLARAAHAADLDHRLRRAAGRDRGREPLARRGGGSSR